MANTVIRILLADDHTILREGLRAMLEQEPDMVVVAEVSNGRDAVRKAMKLSPDVVVMDIAMPELNGIDATRQLVSSPCKTKVLCLSMHEKSAMIDAMLKAGASGYLLKTSAQKELAKAVRAVSSGETYVSTRIASVLVEDHVRGGGVSRDEVYSRLTMREREVLQLIAEGYHTKDIGDRLHISPKTVLVHRDNLMKKLDIDSIASLTRYALRHGIVDL